MSTESKFKLNILNSSSNAKVLGYGIALHCFVLLISTLSEVQQIWLKSYTSCQQSFRTGLHIGLWISELLILSLFN